MSNAATYSSDDNTAYRLISSVAIEEFDDEQEHLDVLQNSTSTFEQNLARLATSYPDIPSELDDDYKYIGG